MLMKKFTKSCRKEVMEITRRKEAQMPPDSPDEISLWLKGKGASRTPEQVCGTWSLLSCNASHTVLWKKALEYDVNRYNISPGNTGLTIREIVR